MKEGTDCHRRAHWFAMTGLEMVRVRRGAAGISVPSARALREAPLHPVFKIAYAPIIERFSSPACAGCRGRQPLRRRACAVRIRRGAAYGLGVCCAGRRGRRPLRRGGGRGADSPGCGVWIGCVPRGRFVKRPYIRFSKLRMRRSLNGFRVRHARAGAVRRGEKMRAGVTGSRCFFYSLRSLVHA